MDTIEKKLDKTREVIAATLPPHLIDQQVDLSTVIGWANHKDKIEIRLTGYIWGEYQESIVIPYAANWWHMFKERYFPLWFLGLSPVQYCKVMIIAKLVYPELRNPEIELERMRVMMISNLLREMIEDMDMEVLEKWAKEESETFGNRLKAFVWGRFQNFVTVPYPANWWQAFKERWLSAWWRDRYPVCYDDQTIVNASEIYDRLKISLPDERHRVILHRATQVEERGWKCYRGLMNSK